MKTLIAFALSTATPAIAYISLSHDYTLEAIYTGKVPSTTHEKQKLHRFTSAEVTKEDDKKTLSLGNHVALLKTEVSE